MGAADEEQNQRLLRARDRIDVGYRAPLDVAALAAVGMHVAGALHPFLQGGLR